MPLFGHNHQNPPSTTMTGRVHARNDPNYNDVNDNYDHRGVDPNYRDDVQNTTTHPREYGRGGAGASGVGPAHNNLESDYPQDYDNRGFQSNAPQNQPTQYGGGYPDPYDKSVRHGGYASGPAMNAAGQGTGMGAGGTQTNTITNPQAREGRRLERNGKLEHAAGILISSQSMKAKGLAKEEEGKRLRMQAEDIAQAEVLEREAAMRRQRAGATNPPQVTGGGVRNDLFGGPRQPNF
ncbi:hypothetical protein FRC03_000463 [Tulasnella sp. 419]|nr:hypothetical protein FRC03_000463 [Tulasnella sp. 419]